MRKEPNPSSNSSGEVYFDRRFPFRGNVIQSRESHRNIYDGYPPQGLSEARRSRRDNWMILFPIRQGSM